MKTGLDLSSLISVDHKEGLGLTAKKSTGKTKRSQAY